MSFSGDENYAFSVRFGAAFVLSDNFGSIVNFKNHVIVVTDS